MLPIYWTRRVYLYEPSRARARSIDYMSQGATSLRTVPEKIFRHTEPKNAEPLLVFFESNKVTDSYVQLLTNSQFAQAPPNDPYYFVHPCTLEL